MKTLFNALWLAFVPGTLFMNVFWGVAAIVSAVMKCPVLAAVYTILQVLNLYSQIMQSERGDE